MLHSTIEPFPRMIDGLYCGEECNDLMSGEFCFRWYAILNLDPEDKSALRCQRCLDFPEVQQLPSMTEKIPK